MSGWSMQGARRSKPPQCSRAELVLLLNFPGSVCVTHLLLRKMTFVVILSFFQKVAAAYYLNKVDSFWMLMSAQE